MQPFVHTAPLNIIFTANLEKAPGNDMMFVDCGFISQNIYLYCASVGLGTVVRGSFNGDELAKILKLNEKQKVVLTQTVRFTAKDFSGKTLPHATVLISLFYDRYIPVFFIWLQRQTGLNLITRKVLLSIHSK